MDQTGLSFFKLINYHNQSAIKVDAFATQYDLVVQEQKLAQYLLSRPQDTMKEEEAEMSAQMCGLQSSPALPPI